MGARRAPVGVWGRGRAQGGVRRNGQPPEGARGHVRPAGAPWRTPSAHWARVVGRRRTTGKHFTLPRSRKQIALLTLPLMATSDQLGAKGHRG